MFTTLEHFFQAYSFESAATHSVLAAMTDASLDQSVLPGHRTLGRMAWHLITTYPEMMTQAGIPIAAVGKDAPMPASAAEMARVYKSISDELTAFVKKSWNDDTLMQKDNLYGEEWERGRTLSILIRHEAHHRGQMTVLMRQAGLTVPDIYGPAKEGWVKYGANPPEV